MELKEIDYNKLYSNVEHITKIKKYHNHRKLLFIYDDIFSTNKNGYESYEGIEQEEVKEIIKILTGLNSKIKIEI